MKRIIAVIFVIICLCGCDMKRIRTESSIKEYETDFSTVYAETVKFSGMKNSEFEKNINAQIQPVSYTHLDVYKRQQVRLSHWLQEMTSTTKLRNTLSSNFILNNYMLPSVRGYIYMFFREISELRLLRSHL